MSFLEAKDGASDTTDIIRDLVQGFAVLAEAQARNMEGRHVKRLRGVLQSLLKRAEKLEWEETADIIREVNERVANSTSPRPSRHPDWNVL